MFKAKYVVVQINAILEVAKLCPADAGLSHESLVVAPQPVLGAGFCRIDGQDVQCYGSSLGLMKASRGRVDADLIRKQFFGLEPVAQG